MKKMSDIIKSFKNGKNSGQSGTIAEVVKWGGEEVIKGIHKLLVKMVCREENFSDDWKELIIIPI